MRILAGGRVVGLDQCPGFDCRHEPLPLMQAASASRYRTRLRAQIRIDAPRPNVRHRGDTYNAS